MKPTGPHLNEAALLAGTNPEIEAAQAGQQTRVARRGRRLSARRRPATGGRRGDFHRSLRETTEERRPNEPNVHPLEERIRYQFRNPHLLTQALTHPSVAHEKQKTHFDNQRLEFLGDAVLQLVITEHLFALYGEAAEGRLTSHRARLVSREALKVHAARLDLGRHLLMGRGEEASGGRIRDSTLADAFEAFSARSISIAIWKLSAASFLQEMKDDLAGLEEEPLEVNPKGQLQEILQAISPRSPVYELLAQEGREHEKTFSVRVSWENQVLGKGIGRSKKQAETAAALSALQAEALDQIRSGQPSLTTLLEWPMVEGLDFA